MPMTKLTCAAALLLLAPSLASANELTRIYQLAVENDTQLRAAEGQRDSVTYTKPQAFGQLLPQINGTGSYLEGESTTTIDNGASTDSDDENTDLRLTLRQALFNAAAWNRWQQADANAAAAEATYQIAEQSLVLRTTEAYFNVLAAADSVRFADAEKKAVERSLELAKKRFEVGLSAITDVQEAQARYDLTVAQMIEAEQAFDIAKVALAEITGAAELRVAPLQDEIPLVGPNPGDVNEWLKAAATGNLDMRVASAQAEAALQGVDVSRSAHYPTVNLIGTKTYLEDTSVTVVGPTVFEKDALMYGLEVTVPIFAGWSTQSGVNSAHGLHEQRVAELEGRRRAVERSTRNAYQGVIAGVSRVAAYKQAVLSNTTALEASEVGLEVGARTAVDVLNAQRELYRAQRDYSRSRYDYLLNVLRLKQAAGQLAVKDLNEIDNLLGAPTAPAVAHR
jgi:outer membrane protein